MSDRGYAFTPPNWAPLRWLTQPDRRVSQQVNQRLLGELFASPNAVIAGLVNGLILNIAAICLQRGRIFAVFILIDVVLVTARIAVVHRAFDAARRGMPTPTSLYLVTAMSWCALQGAMAFTAMKTGIVPLQLLSAVTVMGLVGPICARNYAAPRYAVLRVMLLYLPFVAGAALSGDRWLLILVLQTPNLFFGVISIIRRFHGMAVAALQAEHESQARARHDPLTGVLNRLGLKEAMGAQYAHCQRYVLFYLDLDGFKPINDTFGHQAGDKVLCAVADRLRSTIREDCIVARLGGDEFVIVAPEISPEAAASLAESIIRRVADEPYVIDPIGRLRIGISIGFACAPEDGQSDDLHRNADAALYEAKAAGRGTHRRFRNDTGVAMPPAGSAPFRPAGTQGASREQTNCGTP